MDRNYIDTHAHLNLDSFDEDRQAVIQRCAEQSVAVINVGTTLQTSKQAVEIAAQYDGQYAIVGLHPIQTVPQEVDEAGKDSDNEEPFKGEAFDVASFRQLAGHEKVVGIGECGFDYYHTASDSYATQEAQFIQQIELANELQLPLMIHTRGPKPGHDSPTGRSVYQDVYEVLKQYATVPGNVHFYAGTIAEAEQFFELGFTISFTGVITFAKDYEAVVRWAPLENIHAETDCPFVAPVPHRGKRAEPWMVQEVYKKIAALKSLDEEVVREQLVQNARSFYNLQCYKD